MNEILENKKRPNFIEKWQLRWQAIKSEIWLLRDDTQCGLREKSFRLLRILILAFQGQRRNQLPTQSAALTFSSMIGLGPLIAFSIMISGFLLEKDLADTDGFAQDSVIVESITKAITFAAPQVALNSQNTSEAQTELAPEVLELIQNFSAQAKSGTFGVIGSLMLLIIGIQVLTSIEKSFNTVWGVKQGRKLPERIVTYWTFISLGAVLGTAALSLLTANAIISAMETLPFGENLAALFSFFLPLLAFLIFALALAIFYRFIPNTEVHWKPAIIGSLLVTAGLHAYQFFSIFYVQKVVNTKSLYGSVGIIIVLMLGLYVFWLLILYGGQITYAIQNADHLTNENAWQKTSQKAREAISLAILILVTERFENKEPPLSSTELQKHLRVPFHILNSSINSLCDLGFLSPIKKNSSNAFNDRCYLPAKPTHSITLANFKEEYELHGNNEGVPLIASSFPLVQHYLSQSIELKKLPNAEKNLLDYLKEQ